MDKSPEKRAEAEAKHKAEARTARLLAIIFGGLIVAMIAGMLAFDLYAEKKMDNGVTRPPADAAEK